MKIIKQKIQFTDKLAYMGTGILLVAPYLVSYRIGFILLVIGISLLTPQVYKAKQYNLVLLNVSSIVGYGLQALGLI
jgi:hypothetical protein